MLEPTPIKLTGDALESLRHHLHDRILALTQGTKLLFETKLVEWRRMYEGRPLESVKNFPFQNASNLVVPLIGIHADTLQARLVAAIWKTKPIYSARLFGRYENIQEMDEVREAWEDFLTYTTTEPEELDLFRVEEEWIGEICRYGASTIKVVNETRTVDMWQQSGDGIGAVMRETAYDGPRPQKLAFEDFLVPTNYRRLEDVDIKAHKCRLTEYQLMNRRYSGAYEPDKVDAILAAPDRTSQGFVARQRAEDSKTNISNIGYKEWDIYECWLDWRAPNQKYSPRIIVWYHFKTNTILRAIYDFYPDPPFVMGRLLYRDDSIYGYGLCDTLGSLQEEVCVIHNQRRDNMTVANTKVWRVNPLSKLHEGYEVYPSAMLPAEKDEIEPLQHGEVSQIAIDEERLTLELAEKRSGVSPPMQGFGAGTQGKRGVYTASGTLSLLQEGNRRTDMNISDIRYAHLQIGRITSRQYATFGIPEKKLKLFGEQAELISRAAEFIGNGKMGLVVSNSSASVNKELEKQNALMLSQIISRHYQTQANLIQSVMSSLAPIPLKDYLLRVIEAGDKLMKGILRDFDRDDADLLVPEVKFNGGNRQAPNSPPQGPGMAGGPAGGVLPFPGGMGQPGGGQAPQGAGPAAIVPSPGVGGGAGTPGRA